MSWSSFLPSACSFTAHNDTISCVVPENYDFSACIIPESYRLVEEQDPDDYDPRKPEYVVSVPQNEADAQNALLLQEQIAKIEAMVVRAQALGLKQELLNYVEVLSVMRDSSSTCGSACATTCGSECTSFAESSEEGSAGARTHKPSSDSPVAGSAERTSGPTPAQFKVWL